MSSPSDGEAAAKPPVGRRLDWPDCHNARDLGGLQRRGGVTRSKVLVRSDDISVLTAPGREAMCAYGITTVIDLRSESERNGTFDARFPRAIGDLIKADGVTYLHHALIDDASLRRVGEATDMFDRYLLMLDTRQDAIREIFTSIARAEGGVVFHCFAGKDRTGLVAAILLALADVERAEIAADFGETDVQLAALYERWIADASAEKQAEIREELRCPPERILGVLDHLDSAWGGVASYLETAGVTAETIDRLRARLA
ncbi:MAG TPA: tyrosine-protein phosphatase [Candidatus Dormibacteraeota bacterium]|nr:tyrosine-protein phosphatase [Candidatus Dormibacteraeota bacterium]